MVKGRRWRVLFSPSFDDQGKIGYWMKPVGKKERLLVREDLLGVGGGTDCLSRPPRPRSFQPMPNPVSLQRLRCLGARAE